MVTRDVFWKGSFIDETICVEYFHGIVACPRRKMILLKGLLV